MGLIDRVAGMVADRGNLTDPGRVRLEAGRLLELESPLASAETVDLVVDRVLGLGPVQTLISDPSITDVLINGPHEVWVDRGATWN